MLVFGGVIASFFSRWTKKESKPFVGVSSAIGDDDI